MTDYVIFDLEANADRADPTEHEIIEIGAVAVSGSAIVDTFETLVRHERPLREAVAELTGIRDGDLESAPSIGEALEAFCQFAGDRPLVAHNGFGYDFLLLDAAAVASKSAIAPGHRLDTLELAHLAFPRAGAGMTRNADGSRPPLGRGLDKLADTLGIEGRDLHRALDDAKLTHLVLLELLGILNNDDPARELQRWTLEQGNHPWTEFLRGVAEPIPLDAAIPITKKKSRSPASGRYDIDAIVGSFEEGGRLLVSGREPRQQQADMAAIVARALGEGRRQLVEAPTGTGKTLAYLVPSIEYARSSGQTVIVAAHSRVLQNQILATLEDLSEEILDFSAVLLKGRNNYISLEALDNELDADSPEASTALALAIICGWVAQTPTGDWEDLRTWAIETHVPELRQLRWKLRVESPPGPALSRLDELDFYRRALDGINTADIAVFNHALLVSRSDWMGSVSHVVVDEAHNLEDSATDALSEEVEDESLLTLCDSIWDPSRRRGTVRRLADATKWSMRDPRLARLRQAVDDVRSAVRDLGDPLIDYLRDRTGAQRDDAAKYGMSYRVRRGVDTSRPAYQATVRAGRSLRGALIDVADALNGIALPEQLHGRYRRNRLEGEMARVGRAARGASELVDSILWAVDEEQWINIASLRVVEGVWHWSIRRAPISVAPQLRDVWGSLDTAVLTSATLSVGDSFSHLISRLGLDSAQATALGSPFDRLTENHVVVLTDYLPPPRGRLMEEFTFAEALEIPRLLTLTDGRGMALMTARARLEYVRDHARPLLELDGIPLLAQGDQPSAALVERMRVDTLASLLALRSFWEGIDIPGEALSLLIMEKVPFDPPSDPIVGARMEAIELEGKDPFSEYAVPRAALRFAQGVGRLIRSSSDVGVTVVLDNRLRRPVPYRDQILRSLAGPPTFRRVDSAAEAYAVIADHLDIALDVDRWDRISRIPSADPWAGLEALEVGADQLNDEAAARALLDRVRGLFGFDDWRPGQLETMVRFMSGQDVLAVLPTGSGKSITYQIPALISPGVTLVISPLIALMRDQTQNLRSRGISKVAAIHSGVPQSEQQDILNGARSGRYKLLYVSPERLWSPLFRAGLRRVNVARVAVDEAHCISQWGHSFRPEYSAIPQALEEIGGGRLPVLAATATATAKVRAEIEQLLELEQEHGSVVRSPDRPEILYYVERCADSDDRDLRVLQVLEAFRRQSAIVYVPKRKDTTRISGTLRSAGHVSRPYSGGMSNEERLHVEDAFRHGEVDVVVATKAFGLGIDKPDIAAIVHLEMPASIEEYVQETGRVARGAVDGIGPETGTCVLLVTPKDCHIHRFFVKSAAPDLEMVKRMWSRLSVGLNYVPPDELENGADNHWDRQAAALAVHYLEDDGAVQRREDIVWEGRIWTVDDTPDRIRELAAAEPDLAASSHRILGLIDRLGSYDYHAETWASQLELEPSQVELTILELSHRDILGFAAWRYAWSLERLPGVDPDWGRIEAAGDQRRRTVQAMAQSARAFAHGKSECRKRSMLEYLGVSAPLECGACDSCTPLQRPWADKGIPRSDVIAAIPARTITLRLVRDTENGRFSRRNIVRTLAGDEGGRFPLSPHLSEHPSFGRLELLGVDAVDQLISELISEALIVEEAVAHRQSTYMTLVSTEEVGASVR